jgi:hypothetical protein
MILTEPGSTESSGRRDGGRFPALWNTADPGIGLKQARTSNRDRRSRYRVNIFEVFLANLLLAAGRVEGDNLHGDGIVKICRRRIIECDVAVFADPDKRDVDFIAQQQFCIALPFRFNVWSITVNVVRLFWMNSLFDPGPNPQAETGGVHIADTHVLVHVKERDAIPGHIIPEHKSVYEGFL